MISLTNNRITRFLARHSEAPLQSIVRGMARRTGTRNMLNGLYRRLSYDRWRRCHRLFAKAFARGDRDVQPGSWTVSFAGRDVKIPLGPESMWLDWDTALSIVGHDTEVKATYEALLNQSDRPEVFVDIGANYGTHSLLFLIHGVDVMTFEPNSSCHDFYRAMCEYNGVTPQIEHVAIGDSRGTVTIRYPKDQTWLGSVDSDVQERLAADYDLVAEEVALKPLDDYLDRLRGRRVLVKIDTEGNEHSVLRGATGIMEACQPPIIFECWDRDLRAELDEFFTARGYRVHRLPWRPDAPSPPLTREDFVAMKGTNFIAVPSIAAS